MPTEQTRPIIEQIDRALTLLQVADNVRKDGGYAVEIDGVRITRVENTPSLLDETRATLPPDALMIARTRKIENGDTVYVKTIVQDQEPDVSEVVIVKFSNGDRRIVERTALYQELHS